MTFAQSMVLPPPTARTTSTLFSLQILIPFLTVSILGFGSIPESSTYEIALSSNILIMLSYNLILVMYCQFIFTTIA
jgi:hypothetical protein